MTVPFVVKTDYYTSAAGGSWTQTEETTALSYSLQQEFMRPTEAIVEIQDNDGSIWQRFIAGGYAYIAAGILTIEQPAASKVFDGRIFSIQQDEDTGVIRVRGKDWEDFQLPAGNQPHPYTYKVIVS